jgi:oligosaccharide translocation protein RFT1
VGQLGPHTDEKTHTQHREIDVVAGYFDRTYLRLALSMTGQSLFKHLLTEGDKFLVSRFSPLRDQGGYALATNYGMTRARKQSISETYYSMLRFSRC